MGDTNYQLEKQFLKLNLEIQRFLKEFPATYNLILLKLLHTPITNLEVSDLEIRHVPTDFSIPTYAVFM